jgi:hypothetical protein
MVQVVLQNVGQRAVARNKAAARNNQQETNGMPTSEKEAIALLKRTGRYRVILKTEVEL